VNDGEQLYKRPKKTGSTIVKYELRSMILMEMKEICPCPNMDCPNHGVCENWTSRHLKLGFLNFCAFHTILPKLQVAIEASPESPTARSLSMLIGNQS
jgi:hypothetical protein